MNQCWIVYILKSFIPGDKTLTLYFLLSSSRTKSTVDLSWLLLVSVYPLSKLDTFPLLMSVMCQELALQQGASQLQTTSASLWTFSINITSPFRIHFPLLNPTELQHCRVTSIILLPRIKFLSSFSSSCSLSLAFVMHTFSVQWRTFRFLWVPVLYPTSATSFSQQQLTTTESQQFSD
jgi:hypothetical protein